MDRCRYRWIFSFAWLTVAVAAETSPATDAAAPPTTVPTANFGQGEAAPAGWTLSGGQGRRIDRHILEVTGNGADSNVWRHEYRFVPGGVYRFQVHARLTGGSGGCAVAGPTFANCDHNPSEAWRWYGQVFRARTRLERTICASGNGAAAGSLQFDAVRLVPVMPVFTAIGCLRLGEGESIYRGRYTFSSAGTRKHQLPPPTPERDGRIQHRSLVFRRPERSHLSLPLAGPRLSDGHGAVRRRLSRAGRLRCEIGRDGKSWRQPCQARQRRRRLGHAAGGFASRRHGLFAFAAFPQRQLFSGQQHRIFRRLVRHAAGCDRLDGVC